MTTHASRNDWISVEDSLPEHDGPVLVFAPSAELPKPFIYVGWYDPDSASASFSLPEHWMHHITHWMPLPDPPA